MWIDHLSVSLFLAINKFYYQEWIYWKIILILWIILILQCIYDKLNAGIGGSGQHVKTINAFEMLNTASHTTSNVYEDLSTYWRSLNYQNKVMVNYARFFDGTGKSCLSR